MAEQRSPSEDEEIIARVLAGEGAAFELLVERHKDLVARIVAGRVPREEAAEVAHEVFVQAYLSLPGYRPAKPFAHWLSVLAVRACHDHWRRSYRRRETPLSALGGGSGAGAEPPAGADGRQADPLEAFEAWELLDWALRRLSPEDRAAVTLVHLEGWSLAEAAEALGWTRAAVKLRVFRARRRLARLVSQSLNGEVNHEPSA